MVTMMKHRNILKHFRMDQDYDYQSDSLILHITEDY